jgi:hypothetical protein
MATRRNYIQSKYRSSAWLILRWLSQCYHAYQKITNINPVQTAFVSVRAWIILTLYWTTLKTTYPGRLPYN